MGRRNIGIKLNYTLSKASIGTFSKSKNDLLFGGGEGALPPICTMTFKPA